MKKRKIIRTLHLWFGLSSGLVVVIMAFTGACYAFSKETGAMSSKSVAPAANEALLSPSVLGAKVKSTLETTKRERNVNILGITYQPVPSPSTITYTSAKTDYNEINVNPYNGKLLNKPTGSSFFHFILAGHRSLWLPHQIGHPIIACSIAIFAIELLTGIFLWIPRRWNRKSIKQRLHIDTRHGRSKLYYDLHNTLGGITLIPILLIVFTGLTWSFSSIAKNYYILLTGKQYEEWTMPVSDTTRVDTTKNVEMILWKKLSRTYPTGKKGSLRFDLPQAVDGVYTIVYNPRPELNYTNEYHFYDRYSLKPVKGGGIYGQEKEKQSWGDKIFMMSYDIHSGGIGGIFGKVIAFLVSLAAASLPLTGLAIWLHRHRKKE